MQEHVKPKLALAYRNPWPLAVRLDAITAEKIRRLLEDGHCDISGIAHLVKALHRISPESRMSICRNEVRSVVKTRT